jgi:Protein of unknown function (DUF2778)
MSLGCLDHRREEIRIMVANCTFILNGENHSVFYCDDLFASAFSGVGSHRNNPASCGKSDEGPVPMGDYYIVDRQSGGRLAWLRELISDKEEWFALYADDGKIDDKTYFDLIKRGQFRLHFGSRSIGCVTFLYRKEFSKIRKYLLSQPIGYAGSSKLRTYGLLTVSDGPVCWPNTLQDHG